MKPTLSYPQDSYSIINKNAEKSFWFRHRNFILGYVVHKFLDVRPLFDIGGGVGVVAKHLQDQGCQVTLVEPSSEAVQQAQQRGVRKVLCGDLYSMQWPSNSISGLSFFDVLEHIENDLEVLVEAHRVLEVGGYIFVTVPAFQSLWSNADEYAGHFRRYRLQEMENLLKKSGFKCIYSSYFFFYLFLPVWIWRSVFFRIKKRSSKEREADLVLKEHNVGQNFLVSLLLGFFNCIDQSLIKWGGQRCLGTSCLVVARKL